MPEHTPPLDIEALAKAGYDADAGPHASERWESLYSISKDHYRQVAAAVCERRDQDWQTALQARTTVLKQARDDFRTYAYHMPDCNALSRWAEDTACSCGVEEALATIEAALGEGT